MTAGPHAAQALVAAGTPLRDAAGAAVLLHGRGSSAQDILGLGHAAIPTGWALLAPQAAGHTWYPLSFLAPREQNEPWLGSALASVGAAVDYAIAQGVAPNRIVLAGFSQGACLATEFVGRNPRRYAALLAFTGGLIGSPTDDLSLSGDLAGTPLLLSSGDPDPHVPWARVEASARLLEGIGGRPVLHRYPGRPHLVSPEEIAAAQALLASL